MRTFECLSPGANACPTRLTAENAEGAEKNSDKGKETTLTLLLTVP